MASEYSVPSPLPAAYSELFHCPTAITSDLMWHLLILDALVTISSSPVTCVSSLIAAVWGPCNSRLVRLLHALQARGRIGFSQIPLGIENKVSHSLRSEADCARGRKSICKQANLKGIHIKERAGYISYKFCLFNF